MKRMELKERLENLILDLEIEYANKCWRELYVVATTCPNDDTVKFYTSLNCMKDALEDSGDATEFEVSSIEAVEVAYKNHNFFC